MHEMKASAVLLLTLPLPLTLPRSAAAPHSCISAWYQGSVLTKHGLLKLKLGLRFASLETDDVRTGDLDAAIEDVGK
jgi:hypothetical protein